MGGEKPVNLGARGLELLHALVEHASDMALLTLNTRRLLPPWSPCDAFGGRTDYGRCIDDVRAALNWALSDGGDADLGAALTAVSVPFWIHLSLVDECRLAPFRLFLLGANLQEP